MANQWVKFADQAAFQTYAAASCAAAGIPKPGQRQSDNTTMLGNCWTQALVQPMLDNVTVLTTDPLTGKPTTWTGGTIVANVPQAHVALYGLTPYLLKSTQQPKAFVVFQPKPATWNGQPVP